jgi:hypothetical protein
LGADLRRTDLKEARWQGARLEGAPNYRDRLVRRPRRRPELLARRLWSAVAPGQGGTTMTVNGLQFPASFAEFYEENRYSNWDLKENVDAYGNPLETGFEPLDTVERMEEDTAGLARYGPPDLSTYSPEIQKRVSEELETMRPGFLPVITDFSKIVCFGRTSAGEPFCFDFREDARESSVIHFDDRYARWRKIAPNFDAFISLFERYEEEEEE